MKLRFASLLAIVLALFVLIQLRGGDPTVAAQGTDARTGKALGHLQGVSGWLTSLAFSRDGALLAAASTDGVIEIWAVK